MGSVLASKYSITWIVARAEQHLSWMMDPKQANAACHCMRMFCLLQGPKPKGHIQHEAGHGICAARGANTAHLRPEKRMVRWVPQELPLSQPSGAGWFQSGSAVCRAADTGPCSMAGLHGATFNAWPPYVSRITRTCRPESSSVSKACVWLVTLICCRSCSMERGASARA